MIVTVASIRGAPGTTTWALLLAGAWPAGLRADRVVLEADPAGGVLGVRYDLGVDPGVVSLVSALRHLDGPIPLADHARLVSPGLWAVPGPEQADQATAVWASAADQVAVRLATDDRVWVADVGRLDARSPQAPLMRHAAYGVLVSGCRPEDLVQLPARVAAMTETGVEVGVIVVGKPLHRREEIAAFAGCDVVAVSGIEPDAVRIAADAISGGRGRRSWLWRTALDAAATVAQGALAPGRADHEVAALRVVTGEVAG